MNEKKSKKRKLKRRFSALVIPLRSILQLLLATTLKTELCNNHCIQEKFQYQSKSRKKVKRIVF